MNCDAGRKSELVKRLVTDPTFDALLKSEDGLLIYPPGFLVRKYSPLCYYNGAHKDPRQAIFGSGGIDVVLIICGCSTDLWKGLDPGSETRHLYGREHDESGVYAMFHGRTANSSHKTKLENEMSGNKVAVTCLPRAREIASIYPGDPVLELNGDGKPKHIRGIPKVSATHETINANIIDHEYDNSCNYYSLFPSSRLFQQRSSLLMHTIGALL